MDYMLWKIYFFLIRHFYTLLNGAEQNRIYLKMYVIKLVFLMVFNNLYASN